MYPHRPCSSTILVVLGLLIFVPIANAEEISGEVLSTDNTPIPGAFIGVLDNATQMAGYAISDATGKFKISVPIPAQFLVIQPPFVSFNNEFHTYFFQPRGFDISATPVPLKLKLPPAGCIIILSYTSNGELRRWQDFESKGTFGGVFLYATNLEDELVEAVCWPVFDEPSFKKGAHRPEGIPALFVQPGNRYTIQSLFTDVPGYGSVLLRADNGHKGYWIKKAGDTLLIELEVELARTAVADLHRRKQILDNPKILEDFDSSLKQITSLPDAAQRSKAALQLLAEVLTIRDKKEIEWAQKQIPKIRTGNVIIHAQNKDGKPSSDIPIQITPTQPDFLFGIFEGGEFNQAVFEKARQAQFSLVTILPAWGWTDTSSKLTWDALDKMLGVNALQKMGFVVKAHGVLWLQKYDILPPFAYQLDYSNFAQAFLHHFDEMLTAWGKTIRIWEVMNEPATVNELNYSHEEIIELIQKSCDKIKTKTEASTLINSGHEGNYGKKFLWFLPDGTPRENYPETYSAFLKRLQKDPIFSKIDIIGIQFYPGARLNDRLGGHVSPAFTLGWFVDLLERYKTFGKPVHITEFSVPSGIEKASDIAYWREPWNEQIQAEFIEAIFTIAYGTAGVSSITYWDLTDKDSAVVQGGLMTKDEKPKLAFTRLQNFIQQHAPLSQTIHLSNGSANLSLPAGEYTIQAKLSNKKSLTKQVRVQVGESIEITLQEP